MSGSIEVKILQTTKEEASTDTYPGYPEKNQRLVLDNSFFDTDAPLELPDGEWTASHNEPPTPEQTLAFQHAGYNVDSLGRPLHPCVQEMATDPNVGIVTGKGRYWNYGPNRTADPIVIAGIENRKVLLIKRKDMLNKGVEVWALPGGFVDDNELAITAAEREFGEEAGLYNIGKPSAKIYEGVVADLRTTAHAWAETSAYVWNIPESVPVQAGDDAADAGWFSEHNLPKNLHGSHAELVRLALEYQPPKILKEILNLPPELLSVTPADGGHMAYDHLFIDGPHDQLFVKAHDASRFTDPFREKHSRKYLRKEQHHFDNSKAYGFKCVPNRIELIDDTVLVMDAYREEKGWYWRIPEDEILAKRYVHDILSSLDILATIPMPSTEYHKDINPTYLTYWDEGWNDVSDDKVADIKLKIAQFNDQFRPEFRDSAELLANNLIDIRIRATSMEQPTEFVLGHNDTRQSNIAWHPEYDPEESAKFVDWSWADAAPIHADSTMFLIDIAKSGYDVSPYLDEYFNKDHAITLIGFWLAHSLWTTHDGSTTVRMHQTASAVVAYQLLHTFETRNVSLAD